MKKYLYTSIICLAIIATGVFVSQPSFGQAIPGVQQWFAGGSPPNLYIYPIASTTKVIIGATSTSSPNANLQVTGNIYASGNITCGGTCGSGGGGSSATTTINGLSTINYTLASGTAGNIFNIASSAPGTITFNLPFASASNTGQLQAADWTTFNNKQPAGNYITASSTIIAGGTATHSPSVTFATTTDTNLLLSIICGVSTCTFNPSWTGQLSPARGGTGTSTAPTVLGQLLAADGTGIKYGPTNLVAGSNITITTSTPGQITFAATGGGSGSISTSTTAQIGKVAIWTGLATLGNGALFDNGTVAGVNATSSTITFNIQGSAGSTNTLFNVASSSGTSVLSVSSLGNVVFQSSATGTPFLINSSGGSPIMVVDTTQTIPHYNFNAGTSTLVSSLYVQGTIASTTLPIFGVASSSGTSYLSVASSGWLIKGGDGAGTVSSCGTGTGTVTGNDQGGVITTATAATACTYTFKTPAPAGTTVVCNVTDNSLVGFADISSVSSSAVTFGISSALTGGLLYYTCGAYK